MSKKIKSMKKDDIEFLCKIFNIKRNPNLRTLLEVLVPKAGEVLNLQKNFTYRDLYMALYEDTLDRKGKNRVKVYDINAVINDAYRENLLDYREFRREELRFSIKQKKEHRKSALVDCFISNFK